jgi:hypothetical protein
VGNDYYERYTGYEPLQRLRAATTVTNRYSGYEPLQRLRTATVTRRY